jgi:proline iminopeptidase
MRVSLGDVSLWFDVSGPSVIPRGDTTVERPVLVAVHGGPGLDHMTVKPALEPLAADFQVLYFDLRGHGRSDRGSAESWNMRTWADDLRRLCDALGLDKPVILGSSFGGDVALTYAALFPDHPGGVILANTTGGHWGGPRVIEAFGRLGGPRQPPSSSASTPRTPRTCRLSSAVSATRSTVPRRAGPRNPASSWPG